MKRCIGCMIRCFNYGVNLNIHKNVKVDSGIVVTLEYYGLKAISLKAFFSYINFDVTCQIHAITMCLVNIEIHRLDGKLIIDCSRPALCVYIIVPAVYIN